MVRIVRVGLAPMLISAVGLSAGCGPRVEPASPAERVENIQRNSFDELSQLLQLRKTDMGRPPAKATDLAKYEKALPIGYQKVKNGDIVLLFGAPIEDGASDKILAYAKQAPESGGYVLMQDGKTIKKMSAAEFQSAPKAPGKAESKPK